MTELDEFMPEEAAELIGEFGASIRYAFTLPGTYDPSTLSASGTATWVDIKGVIQETISLGNNKRVVEGATKLVMIAALGLSATPSARDLVEIAGTQYTVLKVETFFSGDLPAAYNVWVGA